MEGVDEVRKKEVLASSRKTEGVDEGRKEVPASSGEMEGVDEGRKKEVLVSS